MHHFPNFVRPLLVGFSFAAGSALAADDVASRVETSSIGVRVEAAFIPVSNSTSSVFDAPLTPWRFTDVASIPTSVAFSEAASSVWVGETLNSERAQRFDMLGDGTPLAEYPSPHGSLVAVSAATGADLAAVLDSSGSAYTVNVYSKATGFKWMFAFPANLNYAQASNIKVSRDGSIVACVLTDSATQIPVLYLFTGSTGAIAHTWILATGFAGGVDLTDNGDLALVTVGDHAVLVESATGAVLSQQSVVGSGGRFAISGNGNTFALGGFDLKVFKKSGGVYVPAVTFTASTSWFGWALAVSRDGSTVGVLSHDYGANYLKTSTRIFDVASGTLLGTVSTSGSGSLQDSAVGAAMSDNGNVLAVASWGTQNNVHPEVRVFNRSLALIGSIDTPGSPFWIDLSSDGRYLAVGSKAVHANTFGSGGRVDVISLGCPSDFNGDGFVTGDDYDSFVDAFEAGLPIADFDGNGFITGDDFDGFVDAYVAGC